MTLFNIVSVNPENEHIYAHLAQAYEAGFSHITLKTPDTNGLFKLDTEIKGNVRGFILYIEAIPAGIAAIKDKRHSNYEVCEFYVVPVFRRQLWGLKFAHALFDQFIGNWEVKQIAGADLATHFWRTTISAYTQAQYVQDLYHDKYWGTVTRQKFSNFSVVIAT